MLGPYRIMDLIGEGGMGAVYRAQDTRLGRDVAVKILTAVTSSDREHLTRFAQEARTTGMLNHPNLLTVYDVGNSGGTPFLVTELLQGETLRDRLARGPLSPRKSIDAAAQMANGLAAAHEKGIVHRDLKPENIFLTRDGRVKILDFGIAKLTRAGSDGPMFEMAATEPGMVLGTVGYMAPEQVRGESVDQRADIFAFGTIVYEMLTGTGAFKRNSSIETLSAILKEEPRELAEILPNIPPSLDRLVRRCLEKDRELRFQSARDLAFNLETLSALSTPGTFSGTAQPIPHIPDATIPPRPDRYAPTLKTPPNPTGATTAIQTPHTPTSQRLRPTMSRPLPRRGVSPFLLTLLFLASIAGAGFAGWKIANRMQPAAAEPQYRRLTFRRGEIRGARFSPDGETVVYSAAWDGKPAEVFVGNRQTPEARSLGLQDAELLAVSRSTELALLLHRDRITNLGTLAEVPLAGGVPRPIADNVLQADWSPDGASLAVVRVENGTYRVEYPVGTVKYQTPHQIRDLRIAPDGRRLAFVEPRGGEFDLAVIDGGTPSALARGWSRGVTGIAWSPDGKEVWLTATDSAEPPALYAVSMTGETRFVNRLTGSMKLYDIAQSGRVLMSNGTWRAALNWQPRGETAERDFSWFDWSILTDLSHDGTTVLFNETREGGGAKSAIYLRHANEPVPVRIGDGFGDALSPDGRWVVSHDGAKLAIVPTGTGAPRDLKVNGAFDNGATWFDDSRRIVVGGALPDHGYQLFVIDTLDEKLLAITPEGIWGDATRPFAINPSGNAVAGMTTQKTIAIYPADGKGTPQPVATAEPGEIPIAFSADGAALFVFRPNALPQQVTRIDLASGARTIWKDFAALDPAGVYKIAPILITPDASSYAFNALRVTSELYVAEGLR